MRTQNHKLPSLSSGTEVDEVEVVEVDVVELDVVELVLSF